MAREELRGEERALHPVAGLTGRDEVPGEVAAAPGERDHVIQRCILESECGAAINAPTSTIPKGRALDLALVLLVLHAASVAG